MYKNIFIKLEKNNHLITNASNPLTDVWFGGILIAAAFAMLWYNERRYYNNIHNSR